MARTSKRQVKWSGAVSLAYSVPNQQWFVLWGRKHPQALLKRCNSYDEAVTYAKSIGAKPL
jgi:hypothetical protein